MMMHGVHIGENASELVMICTHIMMLAQAAVVISYVRYGLSVWRESSKYPANVAVNAWRFECVIFLSYAITGYLLPFMLVFMPFAWFFTIYTIWHCIHAIMAAYFCFKVKYAKNIAKGLASA